MIGTYVPRMCGIATFTKDLRDALNDVGGGLQTEILAMDDGTENYSYPPEVRFRIRDSNPKDYSLAADLLGIEGVDAVLLQHEYGIYGGECGSLVLDFARRLRVPLLTTLHTVLTEPSVLQREIVVALAKSSERLIVICEAARRLLVERYGVDEAKIAVVHHGIPDLPYIEPTQVASGLGLAGRAVLMTYGLLSPSKSIETVIRALPEVVARHPEITYLVVGATHPNEFAREGDAYVASLERLADRCGVRAHVIFHNRYVSSAELRRFLGRAELYVTPYSNPQQISSGTLAMAMGMGKAIISTPYRYAEEMLADGRGALFPFDDHHALAELLNRLLDDPERQAEMRRKAYEASRAMVWPEVARRYAALAEEAAARPPETAFSAAVGVPILDGIPEINLGHVRAMTDDTGILQHAIYAIPNREHGYCTDDNSRALIAAVRYYALTEDHEALAFAARYLAFLRYAFDPATGRFRNFLSYDRRWVDSTESDDACGRALWALGTTLALPPSASAASFALDLFARALPAAAGFGAPRSWAFTILGCHYFLQGGGEATAAHATIKDLAGRLQCAFRDVRGEGWLWCEETLTYANAVIPHALLLAGRALGDAGMMDFGLEVLDWLVGFQLRPDGTASLIGNDGWLRRDGYRARFDQQPLDAMTLVEACLAAWRLTREERWLERARSFFGWFLGNNDTRTVLYDSETGGCRDGLQPAGANLNEGAESTLSWLISLLSFHQLERDGGAQAAIGGSSAKYLR